MRKPLLTLMTIWPAAILPLVAANTGKCNLDVPLEWSIAPTYVDGTTPNLVLGDGSDYVNGQSGVTATIKVCDGTNDAVLQLSSPRSFSVIFSKPLSTNSSTPSWASGSVTGSGILNIRDITPTGYSRTEENTFTTRMGAQLPVKGSWNFRMWNPTTQAVSGDDVWVAGANSPYTDSLVYVHHCPSNSTATTGQCAGIVHETWFVYADNSGTGTSSQTGLALQQVGGLQDTQGSSPVIAGQFSIPFSFKITALQ